MLHHAADYGFTFDNLQVDFGSVVKRSMGIVDRQTKGVGFLMRKNKIDVIEGHARFPDAHTLNITPSDFKPEAKTRTVTADKFIIATGARTAHDLPGVEVDGKRVVQYRHAVRPQAKPKSLIVVKASPTGMELGYFYRTFWHRSDDH